MVSSKLIVYAFGYWQLAIGFTNMALKAICQKPTASSN